MNTSAPPRLATALLALFAGTHAGASLAGDLIEKYRKGRSRAWYWRQVLAAIGTLTFAHAQSNKRRAVRAVSIGWLIYWPFKAFRAVLSTPGHQLSVDIGNWLLTSGHDSFRWWWMKSHAFAVPPYAAWWIACAVVGWLVSGLLRGNAAPSILLLVISMALFDLVGIVNTVLNAALTVNRDQQIGMLVGILRPIGAWVGLLLGGLWAAYRRQVHSIA